MSDIQIYHNPRCSKSRETLQLLRDKGFAPEVVEYLKHAPDADTLRSLIGKLGFDSARQLMRTKEAEYKEQGLADISDEDTLINAMVDTPKLIERPIVVCGDQARLGRPSEQVLEILP